MPSFDAGIAALNKANELAITKPSCIHRQDNTTNSNPLSQLIQTGWGFIQTIAGQTYVGEAVIFPTAFDSAPVLIVGGAGYKQNSDPTAITDLTETPNTPLDVSFADITTTGFSVQITQAANFADTTYRLGYSWIAIGTKG